MKNAGKFPLQAIVLHANRVLFTNRQPLHFERILSWHLLHWEEGTSRVVVNGQGMEMTAGDFLFLPWESRLTYLPMTRGPYRLEGIHILPDLAPGRETPLRFDVGRHAGDALQAAPHRRNAPVPELQKVIHGACRPQSRLYELMDYIVDWYTGAAPEEAAARELGRLLVRELLHTLAAGEAERLPPRMQETMRLIRESLERPLSLPELARRMHCGESTLHRLFRTHFNCPPAKWILKERMARAADLVVNTALPMREIAARVGIASPYYFSLLFRKFHGRCARTYRAVCRTL